MADEPNTTGEPQAGEPAPINSPQPQAGNPEPQAGDGLNEPISLADAKKLRSESSNLRTRLKEQETLLAELKAYKDQTESAKLTETEKRDRATQQRETQYAELQRKHDTLELRLQETLVGSATQLYAIQQGIDPKLAQRLLDRTLLEYDDDGNPTNLDVAFKTMVKEFNLKPDSKAAPTAGGATSPARSQSSGNGEITESYVQDVLSGRINWQELTPERKTAFLNYRAKNPHRF